MVHLSSILKGLLLRIAPLAVYGMSPFITPLVNFEWPQPGSLNGLDPARSFDSSFCPLPAITEALAPLCSLLRATPSKTLQLIANLVNGKY